MKTKIIDIKKVGSNIKKYRLKKNLTQEQLAYKTELSQQYIGNIERGVTTSSMETILKICYALDITPNHLFISSSKISTKALQEQLVNMLEDSTADEIKHIMNYITFIKDSNLFKDNETK
ncbi:helix-turn-helix domain-containing protein [Abyssisolibacter fermentans]|uniref:helix-turn-helix domain-containing protein n=1 Tax=Abyssisolibacter fermentans TaxID=1766203 RepID=UPI0008306A5A|nr:helix-turn-helix transcriptional regulator [Abyssisolibacter fermentans]